MSDFESRLELAYAKLGLREPFIAAVSVKLKRIITDEVPTAATNGSYIKYNGTWCAQWSDEQLFGLVLHENLHVVLMHMWRRGDLNPQLWNTANDAIINAYILSRGYQLPDGGVLINWVTEAMDSDDVYRRLQNDQQKKGNKSQPQQSWDDQPDLEDAPDAATQSDMEATILTAAQMSKACGHTDAMVDRIIKSVGTPKVRWQDVVRTVMVGSTRDDFSYRRFSRRFIGRGLYMPSLHVDAMGGLGIGVDTSCSITASMLDAIAVEVQGIVDDLNPAFVEVVYCDTAVRKVQRFERGEPLDMQPKGGGGTRFAPVFEHFAASPDPMAAIFYLTDMEGNLNECADPDVPVVWGNFGRPDNTAPFGTEVMVRL